MDTKLFNDLCRILASGDELAQSDETGYCCNKPMLVKQNNYICTVCGTMGDTPDDNPSSYKYNSLGITTNVNGNQKRIYATSDKASIQLKALWESVSGKLGSSDIPLDIWQKVIDLYHQLQENVRVIRYDENGKECGSDPYVRRDPLRSQIIAALLYFVCNASGHARCKSQIISIMKLDGNTFSKGEQEVRKLVKDGYIELDIEATDTNIEGVIYSYATIYLTRLNILTPVRCEFIYRVIQRSKELFIEANRHLISRVVGAVWLIVELEKLDIPTEKVERSTDTQKCTASKFVAGVYNHYFEFTDIFDMLKNSKSNTTNPISLIDQKM
jgi:hypothetical protein